MTRFMLVLMSGLLTGLWTIIPGAVGAGEAPQSDLKPRVNIGGEPFRFDWPIVEVGTAEYSEGPTGVTVIRFGRKVLGVVDSRGGSPGTVNANLLETGYQYPDIDAVVFAGGSSYGLEAVTAVGSALKDDGIRSGHWENVALAVGSIIYDFGSRRLNEIYPDKRLAQAAFRAAERGVFRNGASGAGRMAKTGYMFRCGAHSGQGGAFRQLGSLKIAAFTVVNALGAVADRDGRVVACYPKVGWPEELEISDLMRSVGASDPIEAPRKQNTTISLVIINQKMAVADLQRLAAQVHTSMSRAIQPFATIADGDVLYAVTTEELDPPTAEDALDVTELGAIASELMWDAILASVPEQPKHSPLNPDLSMPQRTLRSYAGEYSFSSIVSIRVTESEGRLYATAIGERDAFAIGKAPTELLPSEPAVFSVPGRYPLTLDFSENETLVVNPGLWEQKGKRR